MGGAVPLRVPGEAERLLLGTQGVVRERGADEHGLVEHQPVVDPLGNDPDHLRDQRGRAAAAGVRPDAAAGDPPHHPAELPRLSAPVEPGAALPRGPHPLRFLAGAVRGSAVARGDDLRVSWLVRRRARAAGHQPRGTAGVARSPHHARSTICVRNRDHDDDH